MLRVAQVVPALLILCSGLLAQNVTITHGPILGHVGEREIYIWGRTSLPGSFQVRYGLEPRKLDQLSRPVTTVIDRDNTGWAHLTNLTPDTKYYYQLVSSAATADPGTRGGSFRTLPDAAAFRNPQVNPKGLFNFRFEFGSCNNQNPGGGLGPELPAFRTMLNHLRDKVHFSILNGDWLYEAKREYTVEEWLKQVQLTADRLPAIVRLAPSIVGVWENYKLYLDRGPTLAAWHREVPTYFTPDDHEILNDVYGAGAIGLRNRRAVFRDIGMQAWYDYIAGSNPVPFGQRIHFGMAQLKAGSDILENPQADFTRFDLNQAANLHVHWGGQSAGVNAGKLDREGGDPNAGVYEVVSILDRNRLRIRPAAKHNSTSAYSIGRLSYFQFRVGNVDLYMLDTRSHRGLPDIKNPRKPGLSMIGQRQKEWLMKSMAASDADFFFIASSVNLMIPHVGTPDSSGPVPDKDDAWTAFVDEREQLIKFWDSLGRPVIVMTGDLHNSFAVKVTDRVWEFGSGPHNSANHPGASEGGRLPNGPFDSRGRKCEIRWSSYIRDDMPAPLRRWPLYAVAQINNVFNNPLRPGEPRWVAYPRSHIVIQYYDGISGDLLYAEPIFSR